jgi:chemotaxis protein histidine kinase CheA
VGKYTQLFIDETRRHVATLGGILASLADNGVREDNVFEGRRLSHSIKGMALFEEQQGIAALSYAMEKGFEKVQGGGPDAAALSALGDGLALLEVMIGEVANGGSTASDPARVIARIE